MAAPILRSDAGETADSISFDDRSLIELRSLADRIDRDTQ
jgi:hypothetical protein